MPIPAEDTVTIRLLREDFLFLVFTLGFAAAEHHNRGEKQIFSQTLKLANAINRDNPNWTPYETKEEPDADPR
jgi:hypothetical protein